MADEIGRMSPDVQSCSTGYRPVLASEDPAQSHPSRCLSWTLLLLLVVDVCLLIFALVYHSAISAELQELWNTLISLKANVTGEIGNLRVEQTFMKEKDSKITANVTNLENYVSKVCAINTCPYEWTLFSGKCYYFSNENRDWKKAREFCQSQDSDLAVINSDEELNYLKGKVQVDHLVGMSDLETEGVWKWLDGRLVIGRMWNPGEPNNRGNEDCGEMSNGKLNDIPCNIKQRWICEKTL